MWGKYALVHQIIQYSLHMHDTRERKLLKHQCSGVTFSSSDSYCAGFHSSHNDFEACFKRRILHASYSIQLRFDRSSTIADRRHGYFTQRLTRRELSSSAIFTDNSMDFDSNEPGKINPISFNSGRFKWLGDFNLFQRFVAEILNLKGRWTVARGGRRHLKTEDNYKI